MIPHKSILIPGESSMEFKNTHDLIVELKRAKKESEYTIPRIEEEILRRGKSVSPSTLKRVFKEGSEDSPAGFSVDHTLIPIADVLLPKVDVPVAEGSPCSVEIELLKAELRVQTERVESLQARNDILEGRIAFLLEQIEKKDRRMDEKDELIRTLMEKVL